MNKIIDTINLSYLGCNWIRNWIFQFFTCTSEAISKLKHLLYFQIFGFPQIFELTTPTLALHNEQVNGDVEWKTEHTYNLISKWTCCIKSVGNLFATKVYVLGLCLFYMEHTEHNHSKKVNSNSSSQSRKVCTC